MPAPGPRRGSKQWLQALIDRPGLIEYHQMMEYAPLRRAYLKEIRLISDRETGLVKLYSGEKVPTTKYPTEKDHKDYLPAASFLKCTRRSMGYHPNLPFLRAGAVLWAFEKLRELGLTPVNMKIETLPEFARKKGWNNYGKIRNTFHAAYCDAQNYSRSSDKARLALIYIHHGKGVFKQKPCDFIPIVHKRVQTGIHRFTSVTKIEQHWRDFIELLNKEDLYQFLDDKGAGTAPLKYMIAVEKGLRSFASEKYAMGYHAMRSKEEYHSVQLWRKREAYTAMCRYMKGITTGYRKYISFDWNDHQLRMALQKTFEERHYPYTNGTLILEGLPDPECWGEASVPQTNTPRPKKGQKPSAPARATAHDDDEYEWDSEENEWVTIE